MTPTQQSRWSVFKHEIEHWRRRRWPIEAVGAHWDATEDYNHINEETYSYYRRFVDGLRLATVVDNGFVLDFCARTGNGTLYFHRHGKVGRAICADVSHRMGKICRQYLSTNGLQNFTWVPIDRYVLPFSDARFDSILCFETVEHFSEPELFINEFARVIKPGGEMILTTPNVLWEPVHALAAIVGYHHSEGPHRFIPLRQLIRSVQQAGFRIERCETTVLVPGGPDFLVRFGEWLEQRTRHTLMPWLGLRRILICRRV